MDTRLLHYFRTIVEEGSISRAAARLHMTQPPLSAALGHLEGNLGVVLVERTPRGVVPTPAGQELAQFAQQTLGSMREMRDYLRSIDQGGTGRLRLAVTFPYLWGPFRAVLARLTNDAPDLDVVVSSPAPLETIQAVREQQVDLGIVTVAEASAVEERYGHEFEVVSAGSLELIAALPGRFSSAADPIDLRALDSEPWIMVRSTLSVRSLPEIVRHSWTEHGVAPERERTVDFLATALPLVAADQGVTLVPHAASAFPDGAIVFRQLAQSLPPLEHVILRNRRAVLSAVSRRFMNIATG